MPILYYTLLYYSYIPNYHLSPAHTPPKLATINSFFNSDKSLSVL